MINGLRQATFLFTLAFTLIALQSRSFAQPSSPGPTSSTMLSLNGTSAEQPASDPRLFLTLENTTSNEYDFAIQPWCFLVDLTITDSQNVVQTPQHRVGCTSVLPSPGGYYQRQLGPGETYKGIRSEPQAGTPLSAWGFTLRPGTYTVRVAAARFLATSATLGTPTITLMLH
jgi:hypothetical protein